MAVTGTDTYRDIVTDALRKIGVVAKDTPADADDANHALRVLNRMLKAWQNKGYSVFTMTGGTLTLTTAASYTLSPVRPMSIHNARLKRSGIEIPMVEMTREEYDSLPVKTTTGIPTQFYYDRQREAAVLYIWPVLATAAGETVEYTYQREIEDVTALGDTVDMPVEYYDAVVYGLAARLADDFELESGAVNRVIARAQQMEDDAFAFDQEGSVFFAGPYAD